jgi:formylglycine-generating enzyme required for sulfatase activity
MKEFSLNKKSKKSQVSFFLILGLIIVLIVIVMLLIASSVSKQTAQEETRKSIDLSNEKNALKGYSELCLKKIMDDGIRDVGYCAITELQDYVNANITGCIDNISLPGTSLNITQTLSNISFMNDNKTLIVDLSMSALLTKEEAAVTLSRILIHYPIPDTGYMVIDVSGGNMALNYPISYLDSEPADLLTNDDYKTKKIILKELPCGNFTMGSSPEEPGRRTYDNANAVRQSQFSTNDNDEIEHNVSLTRNFYIGVFEITQKQWELVMGTLPESLHDASFYGDKLPVHSANWSAVRGGDWPGPLINATSFVGILRNKTGIKVDLPTEAQWEYACRSNTKTGLNSGLDIGGVGPGEDASDLISYPNIDDVAWWEYGNLHEVGLKQNNSYGLYDMHGNVEEWVLDWFPGNLIDVVSQAPNPNYYPSLSINPAGPMLVDAYDGWGQGTFYRITRGDTTVGPGGVRCSDRLFFFFLDFYDSGHPKIHGPGFRIATNIN